MRYLKKFNEAKSSKERIPLKDFLETVYEINVEVCEMGGIPPKNLEDIK